MGLRESEFVCVFYVRKKQEKRHMKQLWDGMGRLEIHDKD